MYIKAQLVTSLSQDRSRRRLQRIDYLANVDSEAAFQLIAQAREMFEALVALPHPDPSATMAPPPPDPSKRLWETGKAGYMNWAVDQLIAQSKESAVVGNIVESTSAVGEANDVQAVLATLNEQEGETMDTD